MRPTNTRQIDSSPINEYGRYLFRQIYYETLVDIEPGTELLLGKKVPILFNKLNDSAIDNSGELHLLSLTLT